MPYSADLRCSYAKTTMNVDWFYEVVSENNKEIEYLAPETMKGMSDEDKQDCCRQVFEKYIEEMLNVWITYKVFNHEMQCDVKPSYCEHVWDFLMECAANYAEKHPDRVRITTTEEEE